MLSEDQKIKVQSKNINNLNNNSIEQNKYQTLKQLSL